MALIVVFDTNILISTSVFASSNPLRCLALAQEGIVQSVTCREILNEFSRKLTTKFGWSSEMAERAARQVERISRIVVVPHELRRLTSDPTDDKIIECAVIGSATHIVTGDKRHLLPLKSYQGIAVVSAAHFLTQASAPYSPFMRDLAFQEDGSTWVKMILTTPFCPYGPAMLEQTRNAVTKATEGPAKIKMGMELWDPSMMEEGTGADWGLF